MRLVPRLQRTISLHSRCIASGTRSLHLAVAAADPAPGVRAHDPIGDVDVPKLGRVLDLIRIEQRLELGVVAYVGAAPTRAPCDLAPDRAVVGVRRVVLHASW